MQGVHKVKVKLANGERVIYHYAWRGGPRIMSKPDTREFMAEFLQLTNDRYNTNSEGTIADLVKAFINSSDFKKLRDRTRADYDDHFKHVLARFHDWEIEAFDSKGIRAAVRDWHDSMSDTPRRADMRLSALVKLIGYATDIELIDRNRLLKMPKMYSGSRRDIIWTPEQLNHFVQNAATPLAQAVMMGLWTGQRIGDLLALTWTAYDGRVIRLKQSKTGARVSILVSDELKAMLDAMPRKAVTILTNGRGLPWAGGFDGYFRKEKARLGIEGVTFHDLRGTFVTVAKAKGYTISQISDASGHSEKEAERILKAHYLAADLSSDLNDYRTKM